MKTKRADIVEQRGEGWFAKTWRFWNGFEKTAEKLSYLDDLRDKQNGYSSTLDPETIASAFVELSKVEDVKYNDALRCLMGSIEDEIEQSEKNPVYITICGSRTGFNGIFVESKVKEYFKPGGAFYQAFGEDAAPVIIVGGAMGVDTMAENAVSQLMRENKEQSIFIVVLPANWNCYGKSAGKRRNSGMVSLSDFVIAFWDCSSPGTRHTMMHTLGEHKPVLHITQNGDGRLLEPAE